MAIWINNGALLWTIGGTIFLIGLGWLLRLVGVEYDLQKKEAAYRKILVIAEDDENVGQKQLMNYFRCSINSFFKLYTLFIF